MSTLRLAAGGLLSVIVLAVPAPGGAKPGPVDRAETVPAAIHEIQGSGLRSPMAGTEVITFGIVTARTPEGYFLQTPDGATDGLDETSEGLFVRVDSLQMGPAQIGSHLRVEGRVEETYPGGYPHQLTVTGLTDVTAQLVLATDLPLPAPVTLAPADLAPSGDLAALERLEGMRVRAAELVVVGPTQSFISPDSQAVWPSASFDVLLGTSAPREALPFREPGLHPFDAGTPPAGKTLPINNGNPQLLAIDANGQRGSVNAALEVGLNDRVSDVVGVLDYRGARYALLPDAQVPLDVQTGYRGEGAAFDVPGEVKLVWMDLGGLYDASDDPGRDEPVHSPATYQARLGKLARGLCTFLLNPEVIAVGGVENGQVLEDLAALVETDATGYCPEPRQYEAVLVESSDPTGLDLGFLVAGYAVDGVNPRVQVLSAETFAATDTSAHPDGGSELLFPRPPLVVSLRVTDEGGRQASFTAVNVRLHEGGDGNSLSPGANGWSTTGDRIMTLRARQAARIAAWIEARQQADADEAIAVLGGFEADPFNDGRVDVLGIVTGRPAPADQTWVAAPSPVTSPLTNLTERAPPTSRYNVNERGEFRALDHIVVNEPMRRRFAITTAHPRMNADFPASARAAGDDGFTFSARDPLMARLAVAAFIDADTRVSVLSNGTYSPRVDNLLYLSVDNSGPAVARALELDIRSTLAPMQWRLSTSWPGWVCSDVLADAGGSRVTCANDALTSPAGHGFEIELPADLSLDGTSATFSAALSGGHNDADLSNNQSSQTITFDGRVDLSVGLLPVNGVEDLVPGTSGGWVVQVERGPLNPPGQVTITLDIDAPAHDVTLNLSNGYVTCGDGVATGARSSRFTCTAQNDSFLQLAVFGVAFSTGDLDGGRVIGLRAEAIAIGVDPTPGDNVATGSRRVSDRTNLVVSEPFTTGDATLSGAAFVSFGLSNDIVGVARNARLEIEVDLPPAAIAPVETSVFGQTPDLWTCQAPQADGAGSRIVCTPAAPIRQPEFPAYFYYFRIPFSPPYRPGLAEYNITTRITASSDSEEQVPADNHAQASLRVDQTSDLGITVQGPQDAVIEPGLARFQVNGYSQGANPPRNPRVRLEFDATFASDDVQVRTSLAQAVACTATGAPAGRHAIDCPLPSSEGLVVDARTRFALADTTLGITATAYGDLVDSNPANNAASANATVVGVADLCVGLSCAFSAGTERPRLVAGRQNTVLFRFRNRGPSTARNAAITISIGLPAEAVSATAEGSNCGTPVAVTETRATIRCPLGNLGASELPFNLLLSADTAAFVGNQVDLFIGITSETADNFGLNDTYSTPLPVVPAVDLSAAVYGKAARYPGKASFVVTLGASGPVTTALSRMFLTVNAQAPMPSDSIELIGSGWICSPFSSGLVETHLFLCPRLWPVTAGGVSPMEVRVPADQFIQAGRTISVSVEHYYPDTAAAVDLATGNNSAAGNVVVQGRSTRSTARPAQPTPAYGTRRLMTPTPLKPQPRPTARD